MHVCSCFKQHQLLAASSACASSYIQHNVLGRLLSSMCCQLLACSLQDQGQTAAHPVRPICAVIWHHNSGCMLHAAAGSHLLSSYCQVQQSNQLYVMLPPQIMLTFTGLGMQYKQQQVGQHALKEAAATRVMNS
jgi:hypothetical protein